MSFEKKINNKQNKVYTLKNNNGIEAKIINYGGRIVSLKIPDFLNKSVDIIFGPKNIDDLLNNVNPYYGAIIGRCCNRIENSKFIIDDKEYILNSNIPPHHLHGGINGFNNKMWDLKYYENNKLSLTYLSEDGEEGYPGNLECEAIYSLNDSNELEIELKAKTDKKTIVNLTYHPFFNLNGRGNILDHILKIRSFYYTPINENLIPTGEIHDVTDTPFEFYDEYKLGERLKEPSPQLEIAKGIDHNFIIKKDDENENELDFAASVIGDDSLIQMDIYTNQKGIQFYSGNFIDYNNKIKFNKKNEYRAAFSLEPQAFPNAINTKNFPNIILEKDQIYLNKIKYCFGLMEL